MYQQVLRRFAHFNAIQLSDPAPLKDLLLLALKEDDLDPEYEENDELKEKIAEVICFLPLLCYCEISFLFPSATLLLTFRIFIIPFILRGVIWLVVPKLEN